MKGGERERERTSIFPRNDSSKEKQQNTKKKIQREIEREARHYHKNARNLEDLGFT